MSFRVGGVKRDRFPGRAGRAGLAFGDVEYNGGPTISSPRIHAAFWRLLPIKGSRMKRYITALMIATFGLGFSHSQTAHATTLLDGTTITSHFEANGSTYAVPVSTVAPGTVSPYPGINSGGTFSVSYADTFIDLLSAGGSTSFTGGFIFNGIVFDDPAVNFTNVTIDPTSTLAGFTTADLTFTAHEIRANLDGLTFNAGGQLVLDVAGTSGGGS
jgi:hypothetical protein